jgi:hypothetical protein
MEKGGATTKSEPQSDYYSQLGINWLHQPWQDKLKTADIEELLEVDLQSGKAWWEEPQRPFCQRDPC